MTVFDLPALLQSSFTNPNQLLFSLLLDFSLWNRCLVLFAPAEWKRPTAGLEPRPPQNLVPTHLDFDPVFRCARARTSVVRCLSAREGALVSSRRFSGLFENFRVPRLGLWAQRSGLRGVAEQVKDQRRVVVRHMLSVTHADVCVVTSNSPRGWEVGSEKVYLKYGVTSTWMPTYGVQVDAAVVKHKLVVWSLGSPLQKRHEVVSIEESVRLRILR